MPLRSTDISNGSITAIRRQQRRRVATSQDTTAVTSLSCVYGSRDGVLPRRRRWQRRQRQCVGANNDGRLPRNRATATTTDCRAAVETTAMASLPCFGGKDNGGLPSHRRQQRRYHHNASVAAVAEGHHITGDGSVGRNNDDRLVRRNGVSSNLGVPQRSKQQRQRCHNLAAEATVRRQPTGDDSNGIVVMRLRQQQ